jgi:hypothetical protein
MNPRIPSGDFSQSPFRFFHPTIGLTGFEDFYNLTRHKAKGNYPGYPGHAGTLPNILFQIN